MFKTVINAFKIPDLRKKILYTIMLMVVFRLGSHVPVPGLDAGALSNAVNGLDMLGLMDMISGGALSQATIFAMSITPYINSSIIIQLLTVAVPALERLSRQGEEGRKKIGQYTRALTILLAFIQSTGMYFGLQSAVKNPGLMTYFTVILSLTAGTAFLMWLGEKITDKGIGNGISLIIFAGIVCRFPQMIMQMVGNIQGGGLNWIGAIVILIACIVLIGVIVWMNDAERRIPVQYAKRVVGRKMYGGQSTHIPIKVSMAGVIPIIFAMSIMSFPATIMQLFGKTASGGVGGWIMKNIFGYGSIGYMILYFLLILFFTFFYTKIQFNTVEIANNMKNNGGFIPGIRPGRSTSEFIEKSLNKITMAGAVFIALVALFPMIVAAIFGLGSFGIGGTSILIVVGVVLETQKQIESQMMIRHYKGFLE